MLTDALACWPAELQVSKSVNLLTGHPVLIRWTLNWDIFSHFPTLLRFFFVQLTIVIRYCHTLNFRKRKCAVTLYEIEFRVRTKDWDPHQFVVWQHAISVDRKVKYAFCRRRPSSFSLEHHTRWKWPPTGSKQLRSTRQTKNWFIKRLHQSPNIMEQNLQTKKSTKKKRAWNQNVIKAQKTKKKRKSKYNLVVQSFVLHLTPGFCSAPNCRKKYRFSLAMVLL